MNKRTVILAASAACILLIAIGYRVYDGNKSTAAVNTDVQSVQLLGAQSTSIQPAIRIPEKGRIAQSIDALAHQIVSSSPNQEEAYSFLIEAKSYRIQELKARRAKERAEEAKANYDAELWRRKIGQIDAELAKQNEKSAVDTQAGSQNFQGNFQPNFTTGQRVVNEADDSKKVIQLSDFSLRAIVRDGEGFVARLAYGNRNMPAKQGYTLLGKVNVKRVTANQVVLDKDGDELTLYAY